MIVLGIDPGLSGGLALIESGARPCLLACRDVPTAGEKAKRRVLVPAVLSFIGNKVPDHAFIERAQAMPEQGSSSGFIYGRAVGALEACIAGMQIPWTVIEAVAWKKSNGLIKRGKEDSRQRAIMLFGDEFFPLKLHHNRAEAALIAWHGLMTLKN